MIDAQNKGLVVHLVCPTDTRSIKRYRVENPYDYGYVYSLVITDKTIGDEPDQAWKNGQIITRYLLENGYVQPITEEEVTP